MRCNWPTIANYFHRYSSCISLSLGGKSIAKGNALSNASCLSRLVRTLPQPRTWNQCSSSIARSTLLVSRPYATSAVAIATAPATPPFEEMPDIDPVSPSHSTFTNAQVSRAAAQAIRLCFEKGQIKDARFILHSMALANLKTVPSKNVGYVPRTPQRVRDPINFSPDVSSRLAAHCLIHGLIRAGLSQKAAMEAHCIMEGGIRLRASTMRAVILAYTTPGPPRPLQGAKVKLLIRELVRSPEGPEILDLRPAMVADKTARLAIQLFVVSRKQGHRHTKGVYDRLINFCLLQGEILVACLLFVLMIKDWQIRKAITEQVIKSMSEAKDETVEEITKAPARLLTPPRTRLQPVYQGILHSILESITASWDQDPGNDNPSQIRQALQALVNLAQLLNDNLLPFKDISRLVKTMYSVPRFKDTDVWVERGPRRIRKKVEAYSYIHATLRRLLDDLPTSYQSGSSGVPLERNTYHSLLYYAVHHRQSLCLANQVLEHMQQRRTPPLAPNRVTCNILIRAGTVLHIDGLTRHALDELRRINAGGEHRTLILRSKEEYAAGNDIADVLHSRTESNSPPTGGRTLQAVLVNVPGAQPTAAETIRDVIQTVHGSSAATIISTTSQENSVSSMEDLRQGKAVNANALTNADSYTIAAYFLHLVSRGQPQVVVDILLKTMPDLLSLNPSRIPMTLEEEREARRRRLCRAVNLGPYFFTVVINAIQQARYTGLCERVWHLAKKAEQASWEPDAGVKPWCLPIQAYTAMMRCYAWEAQYGLRTKHVPDDFPGFSKWSRSSERVVGWAYYTIARDELATQERDTAAREMGSLLLRSMRFGAMTIIDAIREIKEKTGNEALLHDLTPPRPDARFYTAALSLFGRYKFMRPRKPRTSPSYWRRLIRRSIDAYLNSGKMPYAWTPGLQHVVEDLVKAGFEVPLGFQHIFVGRTLPSPSRETQHLLVERHRFSYPARTVFRPHVVQIPKA